MMVGISLNPQSHCMAEEDSVAATPHKNKRKLDDFDE